MLNDRIRNLIQIVTGLYGQSGQVLLRQARNQFINQAGNIGQAKSGSNQEFTFLQQVDLIQHLNDGYPNDLPAQSVFAGQHLRLLHRINCQGVVDCQSHCTPPTCSLIGKRLFISNNTGVLSPILQTA